MMQQIDTGYRPEFALGGLYAGMNAANTQSSNELELIRQFLANERSKQEIPLDMQNKQLQNQGMGFDMSGKQLGAAQAQAQMDPEMIQRFAQAKDAGNREAIRKDELGSLLQPFAKQQLPLEQETKTKQLQMQNELAQIDQLLGNGGYDQYGNQATPEQMKSWGGLRQQIVDRMGQTPELSGKTALEHIKGGYGLEEARIRSQGGVDAANAGGKASWAMALPSATQEVSKIRELLTKLDNNELSDVIADRVRASGKKPGTPGYEAAKASTKDALRAELQAQYAQAAGWLQQLQRASGIGGQQVSPPGTPGNPIKLQ